LPDTHANAFPALEFHAGLDVESYGLFFYMAASVPRCELVDWTDVITMLLLVEILDAIAGILILPEGRLVFGGIKLRLGVPNFGL
jgi:hypothetical protein